MKKFNLDDWIAEQPIDTSRSYADITAAALRKGFAEGLRQGSKKGKEVAIMPDDVEVKACLINKPRMVLLDEVLKAISPEKMEAVAVHDYTIKGVPLTLKEAYLAGRSDTSRAIREIITKMKARYEK